MLVRRLYGLISMVAALLLTAALLLAPTVSRDPSPASPATPDEMGTERVDVAGPPMYDRLPAEA